MADVNLLEKELSEENLQGVSSLDVKYPTYFPAGGLSGLSSRSERREPVACSLNDLFMLRDVDFPARYLAVKLSERPCDVFLTNIVDRLKDSVSAVFSATTAENIIEQESELNCPYNNLPLYETEYRIVVGWWPQGR
jgi:hypothetical protein